MIRNLIFGIYPLISDILAESLKANKNWQKDDSFYKTVSLKKPHLFYETQLTKQCKKYTPTIQVRTHSLHKFSSKHVSGWFQEIPLPCTISRPPKNCVLEALRKKCLYIPANLHKIIFSPET